MNRSFPRPKLVATIIAVEHRREFAQALERQVAEHCETRVFWSRGPIGRPAAIANLRAALEWTANQAPEWHLFLEDDQTIFPAFWTILDRLLADQRVAAWYLANRKVPTAGAFLADPIAGRDDVPIVGRRIDRPVHGTHGILYRGRFVETYRKLALAQSLTPTDLLLWMACQPQRELVAQILSPICAQHVGAVSNLHDYKAGEHLLTSSL